MVSRSGDPNIQFWQHFKAQSWLLRNCKEYPSSSIKMQNLLEDNFYYFISYNHKTLHNYNRNISKICEKIGDTNTRFKLSVENGDNHMSLTFILPNYLPT